MCNGACVVDGFGCFQATVGCACRLRCDAASPSQCSLGACLTGLCTLLPSGVCGCLDTPRTVVTADDTDLLIIIGVPLGLTLLAMAMALAYYAARVRDPTMKHKDN